MLIIDKTLLQLSQTAALLIYQSANNRYYNIQLFMNQSNYNVRYSVHNKNGSRCSKSHTTADRFYRIQLRGEVMSVELYGFFQFILALRRKCAVSTTTCRYHHGWTTLRMALLFSLFKPVMYISCNSIEHVSIKSLPYIFVFIWRWVSCTVSQRTKLKTFQLKMIFLFNWLFTEWT